MLQEEKALTALAIAQERKRRAELAHGKALARHEHGDITQESLERRQFAVTRAQLQVENMQTELKVLREFTKAKNLMQLQAKIDIAKARLELLRAQQRAIGGDEPEDSSPQIP